MWPVFINGVNISKNSTAVVPGTDLEIKKNCSVCLLFWVALKICLWPVLPVDMLHCFVEGTDKIDSL